MQSIKSCIFHYKSHENLYLYYKLRENSYQVLQVMCIASEHAVGLYDKNHCTKLYQKKHHSFVAIVIATRAAHS